ncbi:MAG: Fic family protein [Saprospiraceae bacterium]|nr:Fic family protein [Saprospiraceae bacterium]
MAAPIRIIDQRVLDVLKKHPLSSSREIHERMDTEVSYATVKRVIQNLLDAALIVAIGKGKATRYRVSSSYHLLFPIDTSVYFEKEIDERKIQVQFNSDLLRSTLPTAILFTEQELDFLEKLQRKFLTNIVALSPTGFQKEFERLAIDLSWKSSQIEGNTYSLLETERLLKEKETAIGKTREEATMLLNHKEALDFILANPDYIQPLTIAGIEDIHSILMKELEVDRNIRNRRVGISGTNYQPLDNAFQIKEALQDMCDLINQKTNVFEKALLGLVLISYIQPFIDGNKRTARIISNALLMFHKHCPLSFRTVDSLHYKKAMLVFYEQNNISPFKQIFLEQYEFAVKTYF